MKKLQDITLEHNLLREFPMRFLEDIQENERSEFYLPLKDGKGIVSAINFKDNLWEHVTLNLENQKRCATYEEMCYLKDIFWNENEIALQVHPAKSEYINIYKYTLHLWRFNTMSLQAENRLYQKIQQTYLEAQKLYHGKKESILLDKNHQKILIIFGKDSWPTWEEICQLKQKYWKPEEAAVQFNLSYKSDMNDAHMLVLWDATDFELPPKELV